MNRYSHSVHLGEGIFTEPGKFLVCLEATCCGNPFRFVPLGLDDFVRWIPFSERHFSLNTT